MSSNAPAVADGFDLDALFRRYSRELNNYAYSRLRDREAAADIVQDSFVRFLLWRRDRTEAALPQGPRFFLWRIVGNLTIDRNRRERLLRMESLDDVAVTVADGAPTPDRALESKQHYRLFKAALDTLPRSQRDALLMNRLEGLTHAEIGVRLGVSASMVSKYIMAALDRCLSRLPRDF